MSKTFFFYDLETSGLNARCDRIMQFAGQRTDKDLNPIGDAVNVLVKLNEDTLPSPEAVMVTGITPQQTLEEGFSEAEFARMLSEEIFTPDTIAVGFNNVRFDDEFIRYLLWRNFYDPYEWGWKDGRSRWDVLDVVRMTRALRPDGIKWPVNEDESPSCRLEHLTKENNLNHYKAHDAMSDVMATIAVIKLVKEKQSQLYEYLLKMRDKNEVKKLVNLDNKQPFVYCSGRYGSQFNFTTVAFPLTSGKNGNIVVYDLRYDPTPFLNLDQKELARKLYATREERKAEGFVNLPVKELQYNHCPTVAPLGVLNQGDGWNKLALSEEMITKNKSILLSNPTFAENIRSIFEGKADYKKSPDPEEQLYDSFVPDVDKIRIEAVRNATTEHLADFHPNFVDERLDPLLLHYKGRNFPKCLSEDEAVSWEQWRSKRIGSGLPAFYKSLQFIASKNPDDKKQFLLQELQLWAESIMPADL